MAVYENLECISIETSTDRSSDQFKFVTATGTLAANNGADAVGVAQDAVDGSTKSRPLEVGILGVTKVVASGALSAGTLITSDAAGKAKTAAATNYALGRLLEAATADGDIVRALIVPISGQLN